MTRHATLPAVLQAFFGSARLAAALATAAIGLGVFAWSLHNTIGWAGLIGMLAVLVMLCAASVLARRSTIEWTGVMPISLLAFVLWAAASVFWSQYQWATLGSLAYLAAFTLLGLYVALVRDTIQITRAFGNVLRVMLVVSLALEVLSGLLIDLPIPFLGITGNLDQGGPISGVLSNRNELGLLAVIGGISFAIEWRTHSVQRWLAIGSLAFAGLTLVLTRSPIAWGTALVAVAVMAVLYGIRRITPERRRFWQFAALGLAGVAAILAWLLRSPIVEALNAGGELTYRLRLWQQLWSLVPLHPVEGWGWIGQWNSDVAPYLLFGQGSARPNTSAVNAYLDVWFQLGIIGLVAFLGLLGLAFVRSWLLAALAESTILIEFGWLTFVVCCVKASQSLSWRTAFRRPLEQEPLG